MKLRKSMNKKGFTLIEVLISLLIISVSILFFTSILSFIIDKRYVSYKSEDETSLHQIRLLYVLSKEIALDGDMLSFTYLDKQMYFTFYDNKLILEEGYQVFLRKVEYGYFIDKEGCFYLVYKHEEEKEKERIIGCK